MFVLCVPFRTKRSEAATPWPPLLYVTRKKAIRGPVGAYSGPPLLCNRVAPATTFRPVPFGFIVTITDWPPLMYWTTATAEPARFTEGHTPWATSCRPEPLAFIR